MKTETDFALKNADWPAMLVDGSGVVRAANGAAVGLFGAVLEGASPMLSSLWAKENDSNCEQFLARLDRLPAAVVNLKFHVKGGGIGAFKGYLCSQNKDGQKMFVLQLFREALAGPAGASPLAPPDVTAPTLDAGQAHKQKLECALQLTRTVAMDFNNALTSILGHTSMVLSKMDATHPWRSSLLEVEKAAEKAAEIAYDLAAFSRQEKDVRVQVAGNLNHVLRRVVELFQAPAGAGIEWTLALENRIYSVNFDEAKMQQAFMKILDNSLQALAGAGRITVQTSNKSFAEPTLDGTVTLPAGHCVCVEIIDTGCGIPPEVLPRIFEPFFTTKPGHRGLGLAWLYGIVTNHGGSVAVSSTVGQGTSVRLYLPALKKIVRDSSTRDGAQGGNETILLVDDEELLLTMGQMLLSEFGYRVLTASSGEKALEIIAKGAGSIDLVISDLVMPGMSGRELMEHLRHRAPQLRILCMSGFVRAGHSDEDDLYLQKPFTSHELLRKVKHALAAEPADPDTP